MNNKISCLVTTTLLIFLVLGQTSFLHQFHVLEVKPDLVLLFVVSVGLLKGYREGVLTGGVAGIICGIISGNLWSIYILVYSLTGFAAGLVPEKLEIDNFIIPVISASAASLGTAVLIILIGQWFDLFFPEGTEVYKILTFTAWNALFMIPVFLAARRFIGAKGIDVTIKTTPINSDYIIQ